MRTFRVASPTFAKYEQMLEKRKTQKRTGGYCIHFSFPVITKALSTSQSMIVGAINDNGSFMKTLFTCCNTNTLRFASRWTYQPPLKLQKLRLATRFSPGGKRLHWLAKRKCFGPN